MGLEFTWADYVDWSSTFDRGLADTAVGRAAFAGAVVSTGVVKSGIVFSCFFTFEIHFFNLDWVDLPRSSFFTTVIHTGMVQEGILKSDG